MNNESSIPESDSDGLTGTIPMWVSCFKAYVCDSAFPPFLFDHVTSLLRPHHLGWWCTRNSFCTAVLLYLIGIRLSRVKAYSEQVNQVCPRLRIRAVWSVPLPFDILIIIILTYYLLQFEILSIWYAWMLLPGLEIIKQFPCSTQLSMNFRLFTKTKLLKNKDISWFQTLKSVVFIMLINFQMPTMVGILTFTSMIIPCSSELSMKKEYVDVVIMPL